MREVGIGRDDAGVRWEQGENEVLFCFLFLGIKILFTSDIFFTSRAVKNVLFPLIKCFQA